MWSNFCLYIYFCVCISISFCTQVLFVAKPQPFLGFFGKKKKMETTQHFISQIIFEEGT